MTKISRPAIRYFGGKWKIADWIISHFPPHTCYVEPFAGGASVLLRKPPSYAEVFNDLNGDVVNFFTVLRSRTDELIRAIDLTPYSREEFYKAQTDDAQDPLERARLFYVRQGQAFASGQRKRAGWRFEFKGQCWGLNPVQQFNNTLHLWDVAQRLKSVYIEHDDALNVIKRYQAVDTLFYIDPPYSFNTRTNDADYACELSQEQHRDLAAHLHAVQGFVLVSGFNSPFYEELYQGWQRREIDTKSIQNTSLKECLWLSPNVTSISSLPLFSGLE